MAKKQALWWGFLKLTRLSEFLFYNKTIDKTINKTNKQ